MRIAIVDDQYRLIRILDTFIWVRTKELEHTRQWMVLNTLLAINHKTYEPAYWHSFTIERHRPVSKATIWSVVLHFGAGSFYIGISQRKLVPTIYVNWLPAEEGRWKRL